MIENKMRKLAIITCKATKKAYSCKAEEMYSDSPQFNHQVPFIESYYNDYKIISAKYGILDRDTIIDPYDITFAKSNHPTPDSKSVFRWTTKVKKQIAQLSFEWDEIHLHLSNDYFKHIQQVLQIPNVYFIKLPSMFDMKSNYDKAYELMEEKNIVNLEVISNYTKWKQAFKYELLNKKIVLPWTL